MQKNKRKNSMKNYVRIFALALLLVTIFSLVVVKGETIHVSSAATASTAEVKIDNFSFGPQSITVPPGTKVTWTNRDDIPHTVVSTEGVFKSRVLDTDEAFSFTFDKPGNYPYFCSVHPKMTGTIVVK
jgi:plastocyanin